jgi:hypothetical protein
VTHLLDQQRIATLDVLGDLVSQFRCLVAGENPHIEVAEEAVNRGVADLGQAVNAIPAEAGFAEHHVLHLRLLGLGPVGVDELGQQSFGDPQSCGCPVVRGADDVGVAEALVGEAAILGLERDPASVGQREDRIDEHDLYPSANCVSEPNCV